MFGLTFGRLLPISIWHRMRLDLASNPLGGLAYLSLTASYLTVFEDIVTRWFESRIAQVFTQLYLLNREPLPSQ